MSFNIETIGVIESPYREKFAIPRQPGLVRSAHGSIIMEEKYSSPDFFRGLNEFSHLWLSFIFHQTIDKGWQALVRPPRLGGNEKRGVFATRSTHRPNAMGLSVVELVGIEYIHQRAVIHISGLDLLHGTPIVDIKPYLPYADCIESADGGFAHTPPESYLDVTFNNESLTVLNMHSQQFPHLQQFIIDVLKQDPRPAYQKQTESSRVYGMSLYHFNIKWQVQDGTHRVIAITLNSA